MTTSIGLADAVARALDQDPDRVRLQLKAIRSTGNITFKGYGRGAAQMTSLDAARLVIAVAGSLAAKHADDTLANFKDLKPLGPKGRGLTLENFLADHLQQFAFDHSQQTSDPFPPLYNLAAEEAVKLIWSAGRSTTVPKVAIVRWFRLDGGSDAAAFASTPLPFTMVNEARLTRLFPEARMFRSGSVSASALADIATAL